MAILARRYQVGKAMGVKTTAHAFTKPRPRSSGARNFPPCDTPSLKAAYLIPIKKKGARRRFRKPQRVANPALSNFPGRLHPKRIDISKTGKGSAVETAQLRCAIRPMPVHGGMFPGVRKRPSRDRVPAVWGLKVNWPTHPSPPGLKCPKSG